MVDAAEDMVLGEAVQLYPIKPKLKAPGTTSKRLKLKYDVLFSSFAFKFILRRYSWGTTTTPTRA